LTRGERVIAFIEAYCLVPSGELTGQAMRLEDFQKRFIREIYDNPLGTRRAYLSVARKNGKTGLIAGIVLAHVCGPEAMQNTQIVSGAQSRDQASIVFDLASKMIGLSEKLGAVTRIIPSSKKIVGLRKNVEYRALSAEGKTAYGLSPVLAILDEVGQVQGPRDKFVSAITTSQGAYANPLLIAISTQAPTDADMWSLWLDAPDDPRVVKHIYTAPDECALDDRKAWYAANPALGIFKALTDLETESALAIKLPTNEPEFRNYSLNQRVEASSPFVARSIWEANSAPPGEIDGKRVWCGLDLAEVNDLPAFVAVDEDGGIHPTFWLPEFELKKKAEQDHVPYDLWVQQGYLQTTPGRAVRFEYVAEFLRGIFDRCDVQALGFDRHLMKHLRPWLERAEFSEAEMEKFVEVGQGTASMTPALREMEVRLLGGQFKHGNHPILKMCAANVRVVGDSGARKFDKKHSRGRIDGMSALADACFVLPAESDVGESVYELMARAQLNGGDQDAVV
jgi:phage terminase large subunit-like protein